MFGFLVVEPASIFYFILRVGCSGGASLSVCPYCVYYCTTSMCLPGGSQICYCACYCTTSVWRVPNLFLCLLLHHVCLEGPNLLLCLLLHHVCLDGPKSVSVLATAPRLSGGSKSSVWSMNLYSHSYVESHASQYHTRLWYFSVPSFTNLCSQMLHLSLCS